MKYRIATRVADVKEETPIKRGWKNADGKAEFEYGPTEYVIVTEQPLNLRFVSLEKPTFVKGVRAVLTLEVGDAPFVAPGERVLPSS